MQQGFSSEQIRQMEQAAARAWPARRIVTVDGWQVRLSGGGARRANSVLPLIYHGTDVSRAVDAVEALYRADGTRSYVQVSSIAEPADLDDHLAARGYTYEEPSLLMAKRLAPCAMPPSVTSSDTPSPAWLDIYTEPLEAARKAAAPTVLAAVPHRRTFLQYSKDQTPCTSALCVVSDDGIALVECVATKATMRRTGGAGIMMDAVESWAVDQRATVMALQVTGSNTAARALYEQRGYTVVGRYHYRYKDV